MRRPLFLEISQRPEQGDGDGFFLEEAASISGAAKNENGKKGKNKKRESKAGDAAGASAAAAVMAGATDDVRRKGRTVVGALSCCC